MQTILDSADQPAHDAFVEKKSEFIGDACHIDSLDGKPILDVLRANEMTDCVVAVTRYFGGILLGSGGLIRAYSTGASIAVKVATKAKIVPCSEYQVTLDYSQLGSFQNLLASVQGEQADAQYTDRIVLAVVVPQEQSQQFESRVVETFNATVTPQKTGTSNRPVKM